MKVSWIQRLESWNDA